jgi:hypothetical protein
VDEGVLIDIKEPLESNTPQSNTPQSNTPQSNTSQIKNLENPNYGTIKEFSV